MDASDLQTGLDVARLELEAERACALELAPLHPVMRKQVLLRLLVAGEAPSGPRPTEALRGAVVLAPRRKQAKPRPTAVRRAPSQTADLDAGTGKATLARQAAREQRRTRVLDRVNKTSGQVDTKALATMFGCSSSAIVTDLNALVQRGLVDTEGSGKGHKKWLALRAPAAPARPASRQTGAKAKPKRPAPASDDEEEGAPVKLSIVTGINRAHEHLPPVIPAWLDADARPKPPGLAVGSGERRDTCVNYGACLTTFVRRVGRMKPGQDEPSGHCPSACAAFTAIPKRVHLELASVSRQSNFA